MATQVYQPGPAFQAGDQPMQAGARRDVSIGLRRYGWLVVAYNVLVVLWGAVVRAPGSGNGCGEHWPLCGGTVVQHWKTTASIIEFAPPPVSPSSLFSAFWSGHGGEQPSVTSPGYLQPPVQC